MEKLQKIENDVPGNFSNMEILRFASEGLRKNRRFACANRMGRISRFSRIIPKNPGKSPKIRNDDRRSSESTDLESDGRIVKSTDYRFTCTDTSYGKRIRSNGELGCYREPSTMQVNYVRSHATSVDTNIVVLTISGSDRRNWEIPDMKYYNLENSNSLENAHYNTYSGKWGLHLVTHPDSRSGISTIN